MLLLYNPHINHFFDKDRKPFIIKTQNICPKRSIELSVVFKRTYNILWYLRKSFMKGFSYSLWGKENANIHQAFYGINLIDQKRRGRLLN